MRSNDTAESRSSLPKAIILAGWLLTAGTLCFAARLLLEICSVPRDVAHAYSDLSRVYQLAFYCYDLAQVWLPLTVGMWLGRRECGKHVSTGNVLLVAVALVALFLARLALSMAQTRGIHIGWA